MARGSHGAATPPYCNKRACKGAVTVCRELRQPTRASPASRNLGSVICFALSPPLRPLHLVSDAAAPQLHACEFIIAGGVAQARNARSEVRTFPRALPLCPASCHTMTLKTNPRHSPECAAPKYVHATHHVGVFVEV